jgi:hypothetical protein
VNCMGLMKVALALGTCGSPAIGSTVLFSDLGSLGSVYNSNSWYSVSGSSSSFGQSVTDANLFTVSGSGSFLVTEIDVGVTVGLVPSDGNTFYASRTATRQLP